METQTKPVVISNETPLRVDQYGTIRVGKTRVTFDLVISAYQMGYTPEQIIEKYTTLNLSDVYYAIGYYLMHQAEMDAYIQQGKDTAAEYKLKLEELYKERGIKTDTLERLKAQYGSDNAS